MKSMLKHEHQREEKADCKSPIRQVANLRYGQEVSKNFGGLTVFNRGSRQISKKGNIC